MSNDVVVEGIGAAGFATVTPNVNWKELMYQAACRAYEDAGNLNPRHDVGAFITCAEDYWEGFGIFDEFTPDQMGGVLRPNFTVTGDGLHGLGQAYMILKSGLFDRVVVEAHSKASDIVTYRDVLLHAFDPIFHKPLAGDPHWLAGLEMAAYLQASGATEEDCARVVSKNRRLAKRNPMSNFDATTSIADVMASDKVADPLKKLDIAPLADGCVVFVLARRRASKLARDRLVRLSGIAWNQDSPFPESRPDGHAAGASLAAKAAYKMAGVKWPEKEVDLAEVDDQYSFKELQHIEALGLSQAGHAPAEAHAGRFDATGDLPVNPSGGSLGVGNLLEGKGLAHAFEVVTQLRGEAGRRQVKGAEVGVAHTWRGLPTASHAVAVFHQGGGAK
jgi:acetyl-CoA C-acetyltransferase